MLQTVNNNRDGKIMKRIFPFFTIIALILPAVAVELPSSLKTASDGSMRIGDVAVYVIHIGEKWAGSMQRSLNPDERSMIGPERVWVSGTFPAADSSENFTLAEELLPAGEGVVNCSWSITAPQEVVCRALSVSFDIPAGRAESTISIDNVPVSLPGQVRGIGLYRKNRAAEVVIAPAGGRAIRVTGRFDVSVQDNRKFAQNSFSVRISPVGMTGKLREWSLNCRLEVLPQEK